MDSRSESLARLLATIQGAWCHSGRRSFTLEVPPGCGATWIGQALIDRTVIAANCPDAADVVCCFINGAGIDDAWTLARRTIHAWRNGVTEGPGDALSPALGVPAWVLEDRDAGSLLQSVLARLRDEGKLPVLVIDRFHRLARKTETFISELRNMEQDHLISSVVLTPVSLDVLKQRWLDDEIYFATSDYGDNHDALYWGAADESCRRKLAAAHGLRVGTSEADEALRHILSIVGNRAAAIDAGLKLYSRLAGGAERGKRSPSPLADQFRACLTAASPQLFERLLKWLDGPGSTHLQQFVVQIADGHRGTDDLLSYGGSAGRWRDLLVTPEGRGLSCSGLSYAAKKRLARLGASPTTNADARIANFCRGLKFAGLEITPRLATAWLSQFSDESKELWLPVLERMRRDYFFDDRRVAEYLRRIYAQALKLHRALPEGAGPRWRDRRQGMRWVEVSGPHKSEGRILHQFRIVNRLRITVPRLRDVLAEWKSAGCLSPLTVFAVDDIVGSGDSGVKFFTGAFIAVFGREKQYWPDNVTIFYLAIAGFAQGIDRIHEALGTRVRVILGKTLTARDQMFAENSNLLPDPAARARLRAECEAIGRSLRPSNPLGYDPGQLCVCFHYDIPNNSLPALYEPGRHAGKEWTPLFRRPDAYEEGTVPG
jgi:hypothetical protein